LTPAQDNGYPEGSAAGLLLEGVVLRLQADLHWLEACEEHWLGTRGPAGEILRSEPA
jgi:hypothetical protein